MEKIKVSYGSGLYKRMIDAYDYGPTVVLIYSSKIKDSDDLIITNEGGFRFRRKITGEANPLFYQFHRI